MNTEEAPASRFVQKLSQLFAVDGCVVCAPTFPKRRQNLDSNFVV
jgi:hypothetical protein